MKRFTAFILILVFVIMIIPSFSLIGLPSDKLSDKPQSYKGESISKKDVAENNFYLVKDENSGKVMKLTPADYIKGVVAAEMPISFHTEALKAQAVAAHTYALKQIDESIDAKDETLNGAYLSTDPAKFQAYISKDEMKKNWGKNFDLNYKKLSEAVDAVITDVITYQNEPIAAAFHSISGGKTESSQNVWGRDVSYLQPVKSEGDELSPKFQNTVSLKEEEVSAAFVKKYPDIKFNKDKNKWFETIETSDSGTITKIKVGTITTTGQEVRELLKLKSANFTITYKGKIFTFATKGYGHFVGMSQYGADYMARQGSDYKEILLHYYTGVSIEKIK